MGIKNDAGISNSNKYGNDLFKKIDSKKDYSGKSSKDIKPGTKSSGIKNDEGISNSDRWGKGAIDTKKMIISGDYGKSGSTSPVSVKIPSVFGKQKISK